MFKLLSKALLAVSLTRAQEANIDTEDLPSAEEILQQFLADQVDDQARLAALKAFEALGENALPEILAAINAGAGTQQEIKADQKYPEFEEQIGAYGYTWEPYLLKTEDAYFITMFRITGKENVEADTSPRKPVILGHGKFMDSTSWFKSGGGVENVVPLPLQLYDAGFDVWLSNARGTKYS